jgi:hypothetical protein
VVLEFEVRHGLVIGDVVVVENTTGDDAFGKEIGGVLLALSWPRAPLIGGAVRFSYPFVFAPQEHR